MEKNSEGSGSVRSNREPRTRVNAEGSRIGSRAHRDVDVVEVADAGELGRVRQVGLAVLERGACEGGRREEGGGGNRVSEGSFRGKEQRTAAERSAMDGPERRVTKRETSRGRAPPRRMRLKTRRRTRFVTAGAMMRAFGHSLGRKPGFALRVMRPPFAKSAEAVSENRSSTTLPSPLTLIC